MDLMLSSSAITHVHLPQTLRSKSLVPCAKRQKRSPLVTYARGQVQQASIAVSPATVQDLPTKLDRAAPLAIAIAAAAAVFILWNRNIKPFFYERPKRREGIDNVLDVR
jgi:hypothetical protein